MESITQIVTQPPSNHVRATWYLGVLCKTDGSYLVIADPQIHYHHHLLSLQYTLEGETTLQRCQNLMLVL